MQWSCRGWFAALMLACRDTGESCCCWECFLALLLIQCLRLQQQDGTSSPSPGGVELAARPPVGLRGSMCSLRLLRTGSQVAAPIAESLMPPQC
jgi:hypothetical protein